MSEPLFKIHAPEIDTGHIEEKIERKVQAPAYADSAELKYIKELDFQPESAADAYGFDPPLTCELFERRVELPDFTSRKYRFLIGPLRILATKVYGWMAQVFHRSAKNMIQAFYAVVHEQIYVRHRLDLLEAKSRFELEHKTSADRDLHLQMEPSPPRKEALQGLIHSIEKIENLKDRSILLLEDSYAYFLPFLVKRSPKSIRTHTTIPIVHQAWQSHSPLHIALGNAASTLLGAADESLDWIVISDLSEWTLEPKLIAELLPRKLKPHAHLALLYLEPKPALGFTKNTSWTVDQESFRKGLEAAGLRAIFIEGVSGFSETSFLAIFQKGT